MALHDREIVSYEITEHPLLKMIESMLAKALDRLDQHERTATAFRPGLAVPNACLPAATATMRARAEYVPQGELLVHCRNGELLWYAEARAVLPQQIQERPVAGR